MTVPDLRVETQQLRAKVALLDAHVKRLQRLVTQLRRDLRQAERQSRPDPTADITASYRRALAKRRAKAPREES